MATIKRPMLAARLEDPRDLRYPALLTPKFDGVRCLRVGADVLTKSFKLVPNAHIRDLVGKLPEGLDGELVSPGDFSSCQSSVMRRSGQPEFCYCVFDWLQDESTGYGKRTEQLHLLPNQPWLKVVMPRLVHSELGFLRYEEEALAQGFEGVVARSPDSPYKFGRSSLREGYMVKCKRVKSSEAIVTGFAERMHNGNPIVPDAFGRAARPGGQALHLPMGTLGSLLGKDVKTGGDVRVGSGFSDAERARVWADQNATMGRVFTYVYQELGSDGKPRFPRFKGWRDVRDMT